MKKICLLFGLLGLSSLSFSQNSPVDFEAGGFGANWTWTCFENDDNPPLEIVNNPDPTGLNPSSKVAKFTARQTGNPWAGCETMHGSDIGTFNITSSNAIIRIMVWKTKVSDVGIKLVTSTSASLGEIKVANTLINQWEQLTFDFSAHIGGMTYDQLVVFPDFIARPADDIIYFDNIFGAAAFLGQDEMNQDVLSIYPNPTNGLFSVKSDNQIDNLKVFNIEGKLIIEQENSNTIDLTSFQNGIYFVETQIGMMVQREKIIKQ
tara:strand:+ start:6018 stop:6806 length:789 start_codon:yes stop_codon:yes gene_type:complete